MKLTFPVGFVLTTLAVACGPTDEQGNTGGNVGNGTGGSTSGAGGDVGAGGDIVGAGGDVGVGGDVGAGGNVGSGGDVGAGGSTSTVERLLPCNINTNFAGDEYCILPPSPGAGIQLHVGPSSYDDPNALADYVMNPGEEDVRCYNAAVTESNFQYMRQHNRMRPSSHHLRMTVMKDLTAGPGPASCDELGFNASARIPGSQSPIADYTGSSAPEDAGLARTLPQASAVTFEMHYINTGIEPILREAWVNLYKATDVTQNLQMIMMVGDLSINIPAGTQSDTEVLFTPILPEQIRLYATVAHMHAHAEQFSLYHVRAGQPDQLLYQTFDWKEPGANVFNSVVVNPTPDAGTKTEGGVSGVYNLQPGDSLKWVCHVNNTLNTALRFGNQAETAEMCMLVGDYISPYDGLLTGLCGFGAYTGPGPGVCY